MYSPPLTRSVMLNFLAALMMLLLALIPLKTGGYLSLFSSLLSAILFFQALKELQLPQLLPRTEIHRSELGENKPLWKLHSQKMILEAAEASAENRL